MRLDEEATCHHFLSRVLQKRRLANTRRFNAATAAHYPASGTRGIYVRCWPRRIRTFDFRYVTPALYLLSYGPKVTRGIYVQQKRACTPPTAVGFVQTLKFGAPNHRLNKPAVLWFDGIKVLKILPHVQGGIEFGVFVAY